MTSFNEFDIACKAVICVAGRTKGGIGRSSQRVVVGGTHGYHERSRRCTETIARPTRGTSRHLRQGIRARRLQTGDEIVCSLTLLLLFVVYLLHKMSALTHSPIYLFHSRLPISLYSSLASLCLILLPYISLFYPPLLLFHSRYSFLPLT